MKNKVGVITALASKFTMYNVLLLISFCKIQTMQPQRQRDELRSAERGKVSTNALAGMKGEDPPATLLPFVNVFH